MVTTDHWETLDHLTGELDPEVPFMSMPGVGRDTAQRFHRQLHVDTLEELETATNDSQLDKMVGLGPRRVELLRAALEERLTQPARSREPGPCAADRAPA